MSFTGTQNGQQPKAVIFGCAGKELDDTERQFFSEQQPFGFILFARNCDNPAQVKKLVDDLRATAHGRDVPVLIDQEGGRVARLTPPHWRKYPPARQLADLADRDAALAAEMIYLNSRLIADELYALGITVDCLPLADVPGEGSHNIIGDRAYGTDPKRVAELGRKAAQGLLDGGVLPVLKHIPGHGRAMVDSHESLPTVDVSLEELRATDFPPFKELADLPFGMTAHVLYTAIDNEEVATLSKKAIRLIREELGFDGVLMSDDVSMKALSGGLGKISARSIEAGCDVALHCNGKMDEMEEIAAMVGELSDEAVRRADKAYAMLQKKLPFDVAVALNRMTTVLSSEHA